MDRVTSPGSPLPVNGQADQGAELPQDIGVHRKDSYEYTSRPSSRLGFNRPTLSKCLSEAPTESDAVQQSGNNFQSAGTSSTPLSPTRSASANQDTAAMDNSLTTEASASEKIDDTQKGPGAANTTSAAQCERPAMRKTPSVSRLSFPFKTTGQRRTPKTPPPPSTPPPRPPPRHKYSCHPTLLSPMVAGRPYPRHQRHEYGQHGYSRTGLQNAKWFWAMREQEYGHVSAHKASSLAYGGVFLDNFTRRHKPSVDNVVQGTPPQPSPPIATTVSDLGSTHPPITIHPRRGDIASLRDPYSAHVDRCFVGMPVWTISKTLWMHDLQLAMDKQHNDAHPVDESDSESDLETVGSLYSSDDSDTTLVESESESDYAEQHISTTGARKFRDTYSPKNVHRGHTHHAGPSAFAVADPFKQQSVASTTMPLEIYNTSWPPSRTALSKTHSLDHNRTTTAWPTNWYRRWEVLARLCHQDQSQAHALITISSSAMEESLLSSRTAFYQRPPSNSEDGD
ncbi:hypothetical protein D9619_001664 [Psilocybe cf. subviscida]|uniref:Uncharacterized protein n=1 Tax=Psilocybe cf. subviscida TaxID=2480587 RepID=A0A8H5BF00_9AGAR|nr:hypothetical protein D9619_001664 [Psilocybe cf. subviscida]